MRSNNNGEGLEKNLKSDGRPSFPNRQGKEMLIAAGFVKVWLPMAQLGKYAPKEPWCGNALILAC
jgi:hypothetical protein